MTPLASLRAMLAALVPHNAFYSARLRAAAVGGDIASLEDFSARMPFTFKHEIAADQRSHPPYGSNLTYPLERYTRISQTSGTSGAPMRWLDTPESWSWMLDNWARVFAAAEVSEHDRIFFAFSFGPFLGFWTAFECAERLGALCIPGGGMRSAMRLRTILDTGATVLCCTPTYALRLAEVAAEENIDLAQAKVRRIIVGGEPGGSIPSTRAHIEALWQGARVVDHHGMTESGPVSYECPRRPGVLHVIESAFIAEVVDPASGAAVGPGATGELVLTNLGRIGSPLLRYRTGDLVERAPEERCECGTTDMALRGGILGRTDDMVVVRGINLYPGAVEEIVRACGGVAEYRVEIKADRALPELTMHVEAEEPAVVQRLESKLGNAFGLRIPVKLVGKGELPRFEMKAKRWVRL